jgi:hypothetical protein
MLSKCSKKNIYVVLFLFLSIFGLSFYANLSNLINDPVLLSLFPPFIKGLDITNNTHLGGEYYYIAKAIVAGKGFSDPFNEATGPTSWMPPLYPFFLALLTVIFRSKLIVAISILFLKNIVLIFTGITIYNIAKETSNKLRPEWVLLIYLVFITSFFRWFFQITHDIWLILFFMNLILTFGIRLLKEKLDLKTSICWGLIGGGAISTSPVIGFTWGLLNISIFYFFVKKNIRLKKFLIFSVFICLLINSIWTIRNYLVFKDFIPVKSNLFYDAYKSNFVKENGIPDEPFFHNYHPIWANFSEQKAKNNTSILFNRLEGSAAWLSQKREFELYKNLGEKEFLEKYEKKFKQKITKEPQLFIGKVFRRFLATTLVYYPYNQKYESRLLVWRSFVHALPFCFLLLLILFQKNINCHLGCAFFIYIFFLAPYILISYYIRYSIPLVPLQALFIFWGLDMLCIKGREQKQNKSNNLFFNQSRNF